MTALTSLSLHGFFTYILDTANHKNIFFLIRLWRYPIQLNSWLCFYVLYKCNVHHCNRIKCYSITVVYEDSWPTRMDDSKDTTEQIPSTQHNQHALGNHTDRVFPEDIRWSILNLIQFSQILSWVITSTVLLHCCKCRKSSFYLGSWLPPGFSTVLFFLQKTRNALLRIACTHYKPFVEKLLNFQSQIIIFTVYRLNKLYLTRSRHYKIKNHCGSEQPVPLYGAMCFCNMLTSVKKNKL